MAPPRHDADAGGDPGLRAAKAALRDEVWADLDAAGVGRFPGIEGRIPNFVGAEDAADRLAGTAAWQRARVVKCNPDSPHRASSIRGAGEHGVPTGVDDLDPVDLVVQGCVGVDEAGRRLGKGGGFADLEFAITAAAGVLDPDVVVATTVHDVQVRDEVPADVHDVVLDLVVTPTRVLEVDRPDVRRPRLDPDLLTDDKREAIPLLATLPGDEPPT